MQPFPRWIGVLLAITGAITASASVIEGMAKSFTEKNWIALVLGLTTLVAALAHAVTGTGGEPPK